MSKVITEHPIIYDEPHVVESHSLGAMVDFFGVVRGEEAGRRIEGIEYEAFVEMAEHQLEILRLDILKEFEISKLSCSHRIGFVPVGEPSLHVRVEASHRTAAFNAMMRFIDELKRIVPIWKHPRFAEE